MSPKQITEALAQIDVSGVSMGDKAIIQSAIEALSQSDVAGKRGTGEQILFERKLTCEAISGAMSFGYQNTNPPPGDDHWLAPYWTIGRRTAELEAALRDMLSVSTKDREDPAVWFAKVDAARSVISGSVTTEEEE
jgi:hypothetical protein